MSVSLGRLLFIPLWFCLLMASHIGAIDKCLGSSSNGKIVGGNLTEKGELPYQVQIRYYWDLHCGGTLIKVGPNDTQAVLTKASCLSAPDPFFYSVQSGDWDLDRTEEEQVREVDQIYIPDDYDESRPYENDIAIIILNAPFEIDNTTAPISLPRQDQELDSNKTLLASGWGPLHPLFPEPPVCKMRKIEMPIVDRESCQNVYSEQGIEIKESMFCVGGMDGEEGSVNFGPCALDFGGPLVSVDGSYLAGIMSYNYRCAYVGYPAISTRVSFYVDWIESKLNAKNLI